MRVGDRLFFADNDVLLLVLRLPCLVEHQFLFADVLMIALEFCWVQLDAFLNLSSLRIMSIDRGPYRFDVYLGLALRQCIRLMLCLGRSSTQ